MKTQHFYLLLLHGLSAAIPLQEGAAPRHTVRSTVGSDGSVVDWVPVHSQVDDDKVASAPPLPEGVMTSVLESNQSTLTPWPVSAEEHQGPEGTVPIMRQIGRLPDVKAPPQTIDPEYAQQIHIGKRKAGDHWYASSAQNVANHGGSATYSLYKAWTESGADFSLLQTAVIRYNVKNPLYNDPNRLAMQTVEAGWLVSPKGR